MKAPFLKPLLVVGLLFVAWGIAGLLDQANVPYDGYSLAPDNTVSRVRAGSPAAAAGLAVGDRVVRENGVAIEDTPARTRMPRPAIGETRTLVVSGPGASATRDVAITYASQPARDRALQWAGFLIGLCFVGFGLMAYSRAPGEASLVFALTGLCLGLTFMGGPYIASPALRDLVSAATLIVVVMGFATLLHCLSVFPARKATLERPGMTRVLYAPAVLIALLFIWLIAFKPASTASLNGIVNVLVGIFVVGYFGLSVVALIHSVAKASPRERERSGLNLLLAGVIIGLAPVTIGALVAVVAPSVVLPGSDFYSLTLVLVPITLAAAIMRAAVGPSGAGAAASFAGVRR